jgi:putative oxidoreductase
MDVVFLAGRILFVVVFVLSGVQVHLVGRAGAIEYARSSGAPAAELFVPLSGVAIIAGGLSVALGVWADLGALILAAFALSVMFFMHAFWKEQDEQAVQNQFAHFMKNVAMAGGALVIFWAYNQAQGGAPLSITDPLFGRG